MGEMILPASLYFKLTEWLGSKSEEEQKRLKKLVPSALVKEWIEDTKEQEGKDDQ